MKRFVITFSLVTTFVAGVVGAAYWTLCPAEPNKDDNSSMLAKMLPPITAFATLPANANAFQYDARIRVLGKDIPWAQQHALVQWINGPKPVQIDQDNWRWLVNDVMDSLNHQSHPLSTWSDVLIGIYRKKENDPVLRDYAIQHMVDWIQPTNVGRAFEHDPTKRQAILAAMLDAASQINEPFSGTAVQGLNQILLYRQRLETQNEESGREPFPFTVEHLRPVAIELANSEQASVTAKITALQVCAQRGFAEVLPSARRIAADPAQSVSLRLSAIGVIGEAGSITDARLLEKLTNGRVPRLLKALKPALQKIQQRTGPIRVTSRS